MAVEPRHIRDNLAEPIGCCSRWVEQEQVGCTVHTGMQAESKSGRQTVKDRDKQVITMALEQQ